MTRPPEVIAASGEVKEERAAFEAWADDQGFNLDRVIRGDDYQDLRTQGPWDAWQARAVVAPKTALQHFADEVEASGEPEKHAAEIIGYVAPFQWKKHQSEVMCKVTRTPQLEHGLRAPVAAAPHFAIPPSSDVATLQRELSIAYDRIVRERAVVHELANALSPILDAYTRMLHFKAFTEEAIAVMPRVVDARAALAKVQS